MAAARPRTLAAHCSCSRLPVLDSRRFRSTWWTNLFGNLAYTGQFSAFSPLRLFTALGSNITDVTFFVPALSLNADLLSPTHLNRAGQKSRKGALAANS
jgi:hypothetical protein